MIFESENLNDDMNELHRFNNNISELHTSNITYNNDNIFNNCDFYLDNNYGIILDYHNEVRYHILESDIITYLSNQEYWNLYKYLYEIISNIFLEEYEYDTTSYLINKYKQKLSKEIDKI